MQPQTLISKPVNPVVSDKIRIASLDVMRGIVMVIMALDHARDFYHSDAFVYDPLDLEKTTPILFFTRFITHFCAPTFVLLAGTSIRISEQFKTKKELSRFLLTRGLWLVFLEVTVVRFSILFNLYYDVVVFQVIWAIGFCMVVMAAIVRLPFTAILGLGLIITFGHDVLHKVSISDPFLVLWTFIHQSNFIELTPGVSAFVPYPFLPWLGILLLGYCLGEWYVNGFDASLRQKLLVRTGLAAIILFLILRTFNIYGDPAPWSEQKDAVYSLMSFLKVTKYPVSLQYTLITLGPVLILLSLLERRPVGASLKPFRVIGRVPLFYYILHFYFLHIGALALLLLRGKDLSDIDFHFDAGFGGITPADGYPLIGAYIAWATVVLILYPICVWYNRYKSTHHQWWLSYL